MYEVQYHNHKANQAWSTPGSGRSERYHLINTIRIADRKFMANISGSASSKGRLKLFPNTGNSPG